MTHDLQNKIAYSVELLRKAEALALKMDPDGFYLAFSGGKDSQVLYHIAKLAGVRFQAHMQITTVDPPELLSFVRRQYPDVQLHRPEINFYQLIIKKKSLPTRVKRYCCRYLKEQAGSGTVTLLGIRATESARRAKRNEFEMLGRKYSGLFDTAETKAQPDLFDACPADPDQFNRATEWSHECVSGKDRLVLSPIFHWTTANVWEFIRSQEIEYCELYDQGYTRVGCMFCPMASVKNKKRDLLRYPKVAATITKSIATLCETTDYGPDGLGKDPDEIFRWWISNEPVKTYLARQAQMRLNL